jgi:hypothetical protein
MSEELFKENIKKWIELDNQYKSLNDNVKDIRQKRTSVLDKINGHICNNNLQHAVVKISDGRIKFTTVKNTKPLTLQYVKQCLIDKIQDDKQVEILMEYIKENRDYSYTEDIKRYYDDK